MKHQAVPSFFYKTLSILVFSFSFTFLFSNEPLHAEEINSGRDSLLSSPTRPTVQQVLDLENSSSEKKAAPLLNFGLRQILLETVPKAMAMMEYTYPGAVFAPLGRDSVIMGDAIDAAYLFLGQKNRVLRVDLSGSSFVGVNSRFGIPETVLGYLTEIGVDPTRLVKEGRKILFGDRTSYRMGSQSRTIISALYAKYAAEGGDPTTLFKHLNFIALAPNHSLDKKEADRYLSISPIPYPTSILKLPGVTDSLPWHESWLPPIKLDSGAYQAQPGIPLETRERALEDLKTVIQLSRSPDFWGEVEREFKKLGLPTPVTREQLARAAKLEKPTKGKPTQTIETIESLLQDFKPRLDDAITYFLNTPNIQLEDKLMKFVTEYGVQMQGNLSLYKKQRSDLYQQYHTQTLPLIFEGLFQAIAKRPSFFSHYRSSVYVVICVLLAPSTPYSPELKKALLRLSEIDEIKRVFNDFSAIEKLISSTYSGYHFHVHPMFDANQRIANMKTFAETIQRSVRFNLRHR